MKHPNILDKDKTALVIVDVQEAFRNIIPDFDQLALNIAKIVQGFSIMELPIIVTEQYPKGLGHSISEIMEKLPDDFVLIEKTAFSSCDVEEFLKHLRKNDSEQVVLCGLESHICVNQTAHDLMSEAIDIHILHDAIGARTPENKEVGLKKMIHSGANPSCVEMALFELMSDSKYQHFKEIQNLIK